MHSLNAILPKLKARAKAFFAKPLPPVTQGQLTIELLSNLQVSQLQQAFPATQDQTYGQALMAQELGEVSVYAAWLDGAPVGVAYVCWPGHRAAEVRQRWPGVPEIYKLQVARAQRSRGIGSMLFRQIEKDALARGCTHMGLGVHEGNRRARALYTRLGYQADTLPYVDAYDETDASGNTVHVRVPATFMSKPLR